MNRRNALKFIGAMVACVAGTAVPVKSDDNLSDGSSDNMLKLYSGPMDYTFGVDGIRNIVFQRKDKPDITIPFSDIVDALTEGEAK